MTNTFLTFGRPLEVPETSCSKAGQHETTLSSLHTYSKTSHSVQSLLLTLNLLALAEACSFLTTSQIFSSCLQELFTWPENFYLLAVGKEGPSTQHQPHHLTPGSFYTIPHAARTH